MTNQKVPSPLEKLSAQIFSRLPEPIRQKTDNLTNQQKNNIILALAGAAGFMLLWLIFSILFGHQSDYLDQQAFSTSPQNAVNTPTAITTENTSFPQEAAAVPKKDDTTDIVEIKPVGNLTPAQKEEIDRLRENVNNEYQNTLSFRLNESRMILFAQAASRIDKINMRWDTLIGGATSEKLALEYLSSAQIEIKQLLTSTKGMNLADYQEIYGLSSRDNKFNTIANAYKNLVAQGIWGPVTPITLGKPLTAGGHPSRDALRFPIAPQQTPVTPEEAQAEETPNPAATPADSDTLPKSAD
jgi:hypothetical protein